MDLTSGNLPALAVVGGKATPTVRVRFNTVQRYGKIGFTVL
jgi:hypothetical protein